MTPGCSYHHASELQIRVLENLYGVTYNDSMLSTLADMMNMDLPPCKKLCIKESWSWIQQVMLDSAYNACCQVCEGPQYSWDAAGDWFITIKDLPTIARSHKVGELMDIYISDITDVNGRAIKGGAIKHRMQECIQVSNRASDIKFHIVPAGSF